MMKILEERGRKFAFALWIILFVIGGIALNTTLLVTGYITNQQYFDLFKYCGGFITFVGVSYFFANSYSKKNENGKTEVAETIRAIWDKMNEKVPSEESTETMEMPTETKVE